MRRSRISAALTGVAMAIGATAVIAAPAHADTPTTVKADISGKTAVKQVYGEYIGGVDGMVTYISATSGVEEEADNGNADLEALAPGGAWTVVATTDTPGYLYYPDVAQKAVGNVQYRVHYLGGTYTDANGVDHALDPSYSGILSVSTLRQLNDKGGVCKHRKCPLSGHVKPDYKHKQVILQVKKHSKWAKLQTTKTDKHSKFHFKLHQAINKGKKFRLLVKGDKNFLKTVSGTYHIGPF